MFNEVIKELIPFVILEAHPDYKRPYVLPFFGMIEEDKLKDTLLAKLVDFVYDRIGIDNVTSVIDVEQFWVEFYSDCYMDNPPWEANAIINGVWQEINITNIELFEALIEEKKKYRVYMSSESEPDDIDDCSENTLESMLDKLYENSDK